MTRRSLYAKRRAAACASIALLVTNASADNGALALVRAIDPPSIDGDASDWPDELNRFELPYSYQGNDPTGPEDCSVELRVALAPDGARLFVLAEVVDESHVVDTDAEWDQQDRHLLYVDTRHSPRGSCPVSYAATDLERALGGSDWSWDPALEEASWDDAELGISRAESRVVYEWAVTLDPPLEPGQSLGFDYVLYDRDEGDPLGARSYLTWGPVTGKSGGPGRCGDLVFVQDETSVGVLTGTRAWREGLSGPLPNRVRIVSTSDPRKWVQVPVDDEGRFEAQLPAGEYRIQSPFGLVGEYDDHARADRDSRVTVRVNAGTTTRAPHLALEQLSVPTVKRERGFLMDFDASRTAEVDAFVQEVMDYYEIPGASLGLVHGSKLVYRKSYGVRNALTREPVTDDTLFEAASITKPVFAFAVMRLAERGVIDLDQPLYETLPHPEVSHDKRHELLTARIVLSHQTGFPNWGYMNPDGRLNIAFEPGTGYGYSGAGFVYLGRVVEKITGKELNQILREEVLEPFGIDSNMYFSQHPKAAAALAAGHLAAAPMNLGIAESPGVASTMLTEAGTFSKFMIGLLERDGLEYETYEEFLSPHTEIPDSADWPQTFGLGIVVANSPFGPVLEHGGNNGNYKCKFQVYDDLDLGFVVYANSNYGDKLHQALQAFLITGNE